MYTKHICSQESIGTLDWYPRTTLHWHFGWHLILNWHLGQESTNFPSMHTSRSTLGWLSTEHLSSVSQDFNEVSMKCWSRCQLTLAHNAFSTYDFPCIELCEIHVSCSIHDCQSCVREHGWIVLLLLYYYYYAWLHCKYFSRPTNCPWVSEDVFVYVATLYMISLFTGCPDKTTSFGSLG